MSNLDSDMWDREYSTEEEIEQQLKEEQNISKNDFSDWVEEVEQLELEEDDNEFAFLDQIEEENEEFDLMKNARIRLEQGRLYEMLIQHDLFGDIDADPIAVSKVEKEIKDFIMERLEILLGIKAEKQVEVHKVEAQFNDVEVDALKQVAAKLTKGASVQSRTTATKIQQPSNTLKQLSSKPKPKSISPLAKKKKGNPLPKTATQKPQKPMVEKAPAVPKTIEDIARRDIEYTEKMKRLTPEERAEVIANKYNNRPKTKKVIDPERTNGVYAQRAQTNEVGQMYAALLQKAGKL